MPLPQPVVDALGVIKAHATDIDDVAAELKGTSVYQKVFNDGHAVATAAYKTKETTATTQLKEATDRVTALEGEVTTLKEKQPDLAARDLAWQKKLDAKELELTAANKAVDSIRGESISDKVNAHLAGRLEPTYAKLMAPSVAQGIHRKDDGSYELLEDGIPVQVPKGKTVFEVAAERAVATAPAVAVLTNADSGGGTNNRSGGGTGYDAAKVGEELGKQQREKNSGEKTSLAFR